jgi:hypothetical protein
MQPKITSENRRDSRPLGDSAVPFGSNSIRLSGWEWAIVGIFCLALFFAVPKLWTHVEKFQPGSDYRLPYQFSSDYWLYDRYCRWACPRYDTLVVGDSVIWGHYVSRDGTLSHYLNQNAGRDQFANMGIDGIHPAAMTGLLRYYGRAISGKNVILHLNPLWMSSPKHDLQINKEFRFNHPTLVPQFFPKIPCYKDSYSKRISIAVERYASFFSWTSHLKILYFDGMDLPTWTLDHPCENPLRAAMPKPPDSKDASLNERASWKDRGMAPQDFQWVKLETSLQWRFFRQAVELLRARGNTVFVLVGPFNEHMVKPSSRDSYQTMKDGIETWLRQNHVAYYIPTPLPSPLYHDASHPSAQGYAMLAKELFQNPAFQSTILHTGIDPATEHGALPAKNRFSHGAAASDAASAP